MGESNFFFLPIQLYTEMMLTHVFYKQGHQRKNELTAQVI